MKRRRTKRKTRGRKAKGRKVAKVATVRRMIARTEESKWRFGFTGPSTTTAFAFSTPFVVGLTNTTRGTQKDQRAGNKITLLSLEWNQRQYLQAPAVGYVKAAIIRVIIFFDKANNGVNLNVLTPAQFAALMFADPATGNSYMSPLNPNIVPSRFQIMRDKRYALKIDGGALDAPDMKISKRTINLKHHVVQFNDGNAGDPTDIQKNALYAVFLTDAPVSALGTQPVVEVEYLLKWKDA